VEVNYERIARIIEELRPLDEYQVYYLKDAIRCDRIGPLVPPSRSSSAARVVSRRSGRWLRQWPPLANRPCLSGGWHRRFRTHARGCDCEQGQSIRNVEFRYGSHFVAIRQRVI
jgi:hypothetical protein